MHLESSQIPERNSGAHVRRGPGAYFRGHTRSRFCFSSLFDHWGWGGSRGQGFFKNTCSFRKECGCTGQLGFPLEMDHKDHED